MEKERRLNPRIEFHHNVTINRSQKLQKIRNFCIGGAFIQTDKVSEFISGRRIILFTKFPLETNPTVMQARVAHVKEHGIGVQFIDLMGRNADVVEYNFAVFKGTLPLPGT